MLVFALIRLNREYRTEAEVLEKIGGRKPRDPPNYPRRTVLLFVDDFDLATISALRYARGLRPTGQRAVHFVIDNAQADRLREDWLRADRGIPLDFVECADRRLTRAAAELVADEAAGDGTFVTVVLPRRSYSPLLGRLLHDRTADKIARVVSRIPNCAATIIPFDVEARVEMLHERQAGKPAKIPVPVPDPNVREYEAPPPPPGVTPIASLAQPGRATVQGRVRIIEIRPVEQSCVLACTVVDATGELTALFYGRTHITGMIPGSKVKMRGPVGIRDGTAIMTNPAYELLP